MWLNINKSCYVVLGNQRFLYLKLAVAVTLCFQYKTRTAVKGILGIDLTQSVFLHNMRIWLNNSYNALEISCSILLNPPMAGGLYTKYNARSAVKTLRIENRMLNVLLLNWPYQLYARILLIKGFRILNYLFWLSSN